MMVTRVESSLAGVLSQKHPMKPLLSWQNVTHPHIYIYIYIYVGVCQHKCKIPTSNFLILVPTLHQKAVNPKSTAALMIYYIGSNIYALNMKSEPVYL